MLLTIAIHSEHPGYKLSPLLARLFRQVGCELEVWSVGTSMARDLQEAQRRYPFETHEFPPGTSTAEMLNEVFSRSGGPVVATLDAAWMPRSDHWAQNLTRHFASDAIAAVSGADFDPSRVCVQKPWYEQDLLDFLADPEYSVNFANAAFRKDLWRRRAFDAANFVCADKQWAYRMLRAGHPIVMDYEARCHMGEDPSSEATFKRYWALNLSFGSFIHARKDIKQLGQKALTASWKKRSVRELARWYRMWSIIKAKRYWQRDAAQAMLARQHFVRAGGKWAV